MSSESAGASPSSSQPTINLASLQHNDLLKLPLLQQFKVQKDSKLLHQIIVEQQVLEYISTNQTRKQVELKKQKQFESQIIKSSSVLDSSLKNDNSNKKRKKKKSKRQKLFTEIRSLTQTQHDDRHKSYSHILDSLSDSLVELLTIHYHNVESIIESTFTHDPERKEELLDSLQEAYEDLLDENMRRVYFKEMIYILQIVGKELPYRKSHLESLPYIQQLYLIQESIPQPLQQNIATYQRDTAEAIVQSVISEQYQLWIFDLLQCKFGEKATSMQNMLLQYIKEILRQESQVVEGLIGRYYRRMSRKLHPDHYGQEFREEFEEFTKAKNVLIEQKLRKLYIKQMLQVQESGFFGIGKNLIAQSHNAWVTKNCLGVDPPKANSPKRHFQLEYGFNNQSPKKPLIFRKKKTILEIGVYSFRPAYEFFSRVDKVTIYVDRDHIGIDTFTLSRDFIMEQASGSYYPSTIRYPLGKDYGPGVYNVYWDCDLYSQHADSGETDATMKIITTEKSPSESFEIIHPEYKAALGQFKSIETSCRAALNELTKTLKKNPSLSDVDTIDAAIKRYGHYHEMVVRAGKNLRSLKWAMRVCELDCKVCEPLKDILGEWRKHLAILTLEWSSARVKQSKKKLLSMFKAFVASALESEDPVAWMKCVSADDLVKHGGDSNRLYQLYIEGKAQFLLVDSDMLLEASKRTDLFSIKQSAELMRRYEIVLKYEKKEEERVALAEKKKVEEQKLCEQMILEKERARIESYLGAVVLVNNLKSAKGKTLNGKQAKVTSYNSDKKMFVVELFQDDNTQVLLKEQNLTIQYYYSEPMKDAVENVPKKVDSKLKGVTTRKDSKSPNTVVIGPHSGLDPNATAFVPSDIGDKLRKSSKKSKRKNRGNREQLQTTPSKLDATPSTAMTSQITPLSEHDTTLLNSTPLQMSSSEAGFQVESGQSELQLLLSVLESNGACIKGDVAGFYNFCVGQDIESLASLKEAVEDDDYFTILVDGNCTTGIKKFKRCSFKRAVLDAFAEQPDSYDLNVQDDCPLDSFFHSSSTSTFLTPNKITSNQYGDLWN